MPALSGDSRSRQPRSAAAKVSTLPPAKWLCQGHLRLWPPVRDADHHDANRRKKRAGPMRAVRLTPEGLRMEDIPLAGDGMALSVVSTGICGTDVAYLDRPFPGQRAFTLGHEAAGYVDGTPYVVRSTLSC